MPSFDTLLEHLAGRAPSPGAQPATAGAGNAPRGTSRIIASERLDRYTRYSMGALASGRASAAAAPPQHDASPADFEAGRKAGLADGFRRGFDAGVAHADAEHRKRDAEAGAELGIRIATLLDGVRQRLEAIERDAAEEVAALALEVARHALRATLAVRPETIVPVVQEALAALVDESVRLHLHLNPADAALVRDELGARLAGSNCEIVEDDSISAGGCRIATPRAEIDATLETRWRRTLAALGRSEGSAEPVR